MPFKYEVNGQLVEFDKEPTEVDIDEAAIQLGGGQQAEPTPQAGPSFSTADFEISDMNTKSPLSFAQNLMLGLAANDESRIGYLTEEFAGKEVKVDPERGLLVDGMVVNPKGFDLGDVPRNAGYAIPFAGQVLGSILGGMLGGLATTPTVAGIPLGVAGGALAGGTLGATAGEGLRLAMGDILGLDVDGKDVLHNLTEEAKYAAIGETLGLGVGASAIGIKGALKPLGKTKFIRGIANIYRKTFIKLGKSISPTAAQYVGGVDRRAAQYLGYVTPSKLLTEANFDPSRTTKIVKKVLFGNENLNIIDDIVKGKNVQSGVVRMAKVIKDVGDDTYDDFIKQTFGISDDTIKTIKNSNLDDLISPKNLSENRAYDIAEDVVNGIKGHSEKLSKDINRLEIQAIKAGKGSVKMPIEDIGKEVDKIIRSTNLSKGLKVPGFQRQAPPTVRGMRNLETIRDMFYAKPTKEAAKEALGKKITQKEIKYKLIDKVNLKQAKIFKDKLQAQINQFISNDTVPTELRKAAGNINKAFRNRYYNYMGTKDVSANYRLFADVLEDLRIQGGNGIGRVKNLIKAKGGLEQMDELVKQLPESGKIYSDISKMRAGDELKNISAKKLMTRFEGMLNKTEILDLGKKSGGEELLENFSHRFATSKNPALNQLAFFGDAQNSLAAKKFLEGSTNVLRLTTLATMLGLGGVLGYQKLGPLGAVGGTAAVLALSRPRNLARLLVAIDKGTFTKAIGKGTGKIGQKVTSKESLAILRRLMTQELKST